MKFFSLGKDGGPESHVTGFWFVELKNLFSVALLRFTDGTRESFHSHAFNSVSWLLRGRLHERHMSLFSVDYLPRWRPIITTRGTFHQVSSIGTSWVLTFRGPWAKNWCEFDPESRKFTMLGHGRVVEKGC